MAAIDLNELIEKLSDTANPIMYQYFLNLAKRTIILNQEVTENVVEEVILPLIQMDNDGTGEPITIYLNTGGGSTYAGLTLCSIIDKLKTPTKIVVFSYAMSMGALILMGGYNNPNVTKECYPFTVGLIHGGSQLFEGTLSQARDYWSFNEKYEEKIKEYILSHSLISNEEYLKMEKTEWYLTAEEMLRLKIIDNII